MNFLGHLYFSKNDPELMYANLFGDFVKGPDLSAYTPKIQEGIRLHRQIDFYIDQHPEVLALQHLLHADLPKISGIAIDLYYDHLLAVHWSEFHTSSLETFVRDFFAYPVDRAAYGKPEFWYVLSKMQEGDWLINYQYPEGLAFACTGLSRRISFENALGKAPEVFVVFREEIEKSFRIFMRDAQFFFQNMDSNNG